jgi:hypothetical protein
MDGDSGDECMAVVIGHLSAEFPESAFQTLLTKAFEVRA